MKRFLLPGLLALCALPAAAQSLADELTGLFLLRREPTALYSTIAADGFREVRFSKGVKTFTRGSDTFQVRLGKQQVLSISYSTRNTKNYQRLTANWKLLGFDEDSMGKLAETGPKGIYWIFGTRYRHRVVYTIIESIAYSKKIEDAVLE
jgi:hypothetical protein